MRRSFHKKDSAACLGPRVRALRRQRGLTLKALGHRAGLSHPFLSQLERGLARPSVDSMERIADALQVPVIALWTEPRQTGPRVLRAGESPPDAGEALYLREWSGGGRQWPDQAETRAGAVLVYVIRGALEVDVDREVFALAEGDTLYFDGSAPHRLRRTGPVGTRALYVATAG